MPDKSSIPFKPKIAFDSERWQENLVAAPQYAELSCTSNFTFLTGASHPEELVAKAAELGTRAIAVTDLNSLAGVVRGHVAARSYPVQYIVGSKVEIVHEESSLTILVYPKDRAAYGRLCRLLTVGKMRAEKTETNLSLADFLQYSAGLVCIIIPNYTTHDYRRELNSGFTDACQQIQQQISEEIDLSIAVQKTYSNSADQRFERTLALADELRIPIVAINDVHCHVRGRRIVQDVLTCVREGTTLEKANYLLYQNGERYLKSPKEMSRLFRKYPQAISRTMEIAEACSFFGLDQLRYEYPVGLHPEEHTAESYLQHLVEEGIKKRFPQGLSKQLRADLAAELKLVAELKYEKYFLTCFDIVRFARERRILCQGRGAAANSIVCFLLEITSVDPTQVQLLFARFVSKERMEPPDIDIDFEHERREEVIQYIYNKYGREYAGIAGAISTYRSRSAVRDVGKAMGLSLEIVDKLAKSIHVWTEREISDEDYTKIGVDKNDWSIRVTMTIAKEIYGFPRHLSQHSGGFIICKHPLCETVPIMNARMQDRTMIEWDKNDIDELGMLKIDVLALGMLTAVRKAFDLVNAKRTKQGLNKISLYSVPPEDPETYAMISRADTVGVFQVESRAQMSMLPRLRPKTFYDLVIQVAIVRPGPIQGNMVHPYLKRRDGLEEPYYPDARAKEVLGKTLGVPLFQEQAMRLAIVCAGFTPGEAEQLRRAMSQWKRNENVIAAFKERIMDGMRANGYEAEFAETCMSQLKGFSEYGFPESHAASFALITYASCWLKCHYQTEFVCALLNSQPMGFYRPAQLVSDAKRNGISFLPLDISHSSFDCLVSAEKQIRIGLRYAKGINQLQAEILLAVCRQTKILSIEELWNITRFKGLRRSTLETLAKADAFRSLGLNSREALWTIQKLPAVPTPLEILINQKTEEKVALPVKDLKSEMFDDYAQSGMSLKAHPMDFVREFLNSKGVLRAIDLAEVQLPKYKKVRVSVAGLTVLRQRPGTAKGVTFITLEDETGFINLMIRPDNFETYQTAIVSGQSLLARGVLDRTAEVHYVMVEFLEAIDQIVINRENLVMPTRSHAY